MYPVRTIFSEPKFLGCIDLPNFLTHVAPLHALRALESSANTDEDDDDDDQNNKNNKQQIIESLVYQFSRRAWGKKKYSKIFSQYLVFYNLDNLLLVT